VQRWYAAASPVIGTKDIDTTLCDFANAWRKITDPTNGCFLEAVLEEVKRAPPHPVAKLFPGEGHRLLVGLCAALQRYNGTKPFALSCRVAAKLLGIDHVQAHRWMRTLEALEIIRRTSTGSLAKRKASRFFFMTDDPPRRRKQK
jgi:hypothetical protein